MYEVRYVNDTNHAAGQIGLGRHLSVPDAFSQRCIAPDSLHSSLSSAKSLSVILCRFPNVVTSAVLRFSSTNLPLRNLPIRFLPLGSHR